MYARHVIHVAVGSPYASCGTVHPASDGRVDGNGVSANGHAAPNAAHASANVCRVLHFFSLPSAWPGSVFVVRGKKSADEQDVWDAG